MPSLGFGNDVPLESVVEQQVASLSEDDARAMAEMVLMGIKFKLGEFSPAGNRWWSVTGPDGKRYTGMGGLELSDVVQRTLRDHGVKR